MNMRQVSALILGMVLVPDVPAQEREWELPKPGQVGNIWLETHPTGWRATFYYNGRATLDYGGPGGPNPRADTPPGSISVEEVYSLLLPCLKEGGTTRWDMSVVFFMGGENICVRYIEQTEENKTVVRALLGELLDKATIPGPFFAKEHLEEFLATEPFIDGDLPPIFEYKKVSSREEREKAAAFMRKNIIRKRAGLRQLPSPEEEERAIDEELAKWKAKCGFPEDEDTPPPNRLWLYAVILSALCAGAVLWLIRKKKRKHTWT